MSLDTGKIWIRSLSTQAVLHSFIVHFFDSSASLCPFCLTRPSIPLHSLVLLCTATIAVHAADVAHGSNTSSITCFEVPLHSLAVVLLQQRPLRLILDSALSKSQHRGYKEPQVQWIRYCESNATDPFNPQALDILNYLADGIESKGWSIGANSPSQSQNTFCTWVRFPN
jgi:hypothetical protein